MYGGVFLNLVAVFVCVRDLLLVRAGDFAVEGRYTPSTHILLLKKGIWDGSVLVRHKLFEELIWWGKKLYRSWGA